MVYRQVVGGGLPEVADHCRDRGLAREVYVGGRERTADEALKDEQVKKLQQKIGEIVLDNDILREALKPYSLDRKTSDA
jgi:hypothetical protein